MLAIILLNIVNFTVFLKKVFAVFFIFALVKPGKIFLRLFFYKIVVKVYSFVRMMFRKLGWRGLEDNILSFLLNQKFVHIIVIIVTISLLVINLTPKTRASGFF
jgi:hypothetical protein